MLGQKSLTIFAGQWIGYALQLASSVIAARILGPEAIGRMAFAFGVIGLFLMVTAFGFSQAHMKKVAEGMDLGLCLGTYLSLVAALNALALLLGLAAYPWLRPHLGGSTEQAAFFLFFIYFVISNFGTALTQTFWARQELVKGAMTIVFSRAARLVSMAAVLWMWPNLISLAACLLLESVVLVASGLFMMPRVRIIPPTRASLMSYWKFTQPVSLSSFLGMLNESLDRVVLGRNFPGAPVGHYNVARNILEAIKTIPAAVSTALLPGLTKALAQGGTLAVRAQFDSVYRRLLLLTTPLAALGVFWSSRIVRFLYGPAYAPAASALAVFFVVFWLICLTLLYNYILYAGEAHRVFIWLSPLAQGMYVLALWLLCQRERGLGALGASLAVGVPYLVSFPVVYHLSRKKYGVSFGKYGVSMVVSGAVMYGLMNRLSAWKPGLGPEFLWSAVGLGCYAAALALLAGGPFLEDLRYFARLSNPAGLKRFLKSDFYANGA
jgi:O-antigen/teichoic acid export membrane protein